MPTRRYKVFMERSRGRGRQPIRTKVLTFAASPAQAERFAHFRKPGFSVVRVERD